MIDLGSQKSRVFAQPLGSDFALGVVDGLKLRTKSSAPDAMARVTLIVNTSRMARRITSLFQGKGAGFLPKILLLDQIDALLSDVPPPRARSNLKRRLELSQLIAPVVEKHPELAAKASVFAIVDSLAALMDEMQGEGVSVEEIAALDVSDQSGHWQNAQTLIGIAHNYVGSLEDEQDKDARQRNVVLRLINQWAITPPKYPVILAGSTGSRGTTAMLMKALAQLPNGAVILPGFDTDLPKSVWDRLENPLTSEDHPQYRFSKLLRDLDLDPIAVPRWHESLVTAPSRNAVVSLSLRPAPVTDSWLDEGPELSNLVDSLRHVTLLEAPSQRSEALTIAMRLRRAAGTGQTAALITPDRNLGRQVTAALERWDIVPDDSGGTPLHLTAAGRFVRHTAELLFRALDVEQLLVLLKHPLTQSGDEFPNHSLFTQRFELALRRKGLANPDAQQLRDVVALASKDAADSEDMLVWADWMTLAFVFDRNRGKRPLKEWITRHRSISERISGGIEGQTGALWEKAPGRAVASVFEALEDNAEHAGPMDGRDYLQLLTGLLTQEEIRDRDEPHPGVMIWGTLEARVQGADLVILAGLNEGVWPEAITADTWLNRSLRHQAGLLLPDRKIGLSAHDYQQAIAAPEVWLSRSIRSDESETVPSRWINRLINLIGGLHDNDGPKALHQMRARGNAWLAKSQAFETVVPGEPAGRAAPRPPVATRPRDFSVTEIKTLIRDPYAIYAKHCLKLRKLDPLVQEPDAAMRGIVVHDIMETFVNHVRDSPADLNVVGLMGVVDTVLEKTVPWPATRMMWRARIERISDWIVESERQRQALGSAFATEKSAQGRLSLGSIGGSIKARADRIDLDENGRALIYDYKSGYPPSVAEQKQFDKQLLIEAAMVEEGAFEALGPTPVRNAIYIGLGSKPKEVSAPLEAEAPHETLEGLQELIASYLDPDQHFLSRRMVQTQAFTGDYDHLARHGEWDDSDAPDPTDLT